MSLYNTYNNENIISRAVIAGILDVLNNSIRYNQVWSDEETEEVSIPWYYNQSGDERFMQDFYTHYADCNFPKPVDGNFDRIPRGVITYTGADIDANRITNRFVQGRYVKLIDGKLQSFVSFLYSIPLNIKFDCEILLDTQVTALKVEQAIRETFYKTITFYVYYKGMRLGCTSGFSEQIGVDKLIEYSFDADNKIKINFTIEVETYQPVFDPTVEVNANNYMRGIGYRIYQDEQKNDGNIVITSPISDITIPKSYPLRIEWNYNNEGGIIKNVDAYWAYAGTTEWNLIEKGIPNHQFWDWTISETFTSYVHPIIVWEEDSSTTLYREPTISILPDISTNIISEDSFIIVNPGYFMTNTTDSSISIILEMKDTQNRTIYTNDNDIYLNLKDYSIDASNPVWINPDVSIVFPGTVDYKEIDLYIVNSVNKDVFDVIRNIKII